LARFGVAPAQVLHEWNTIVHVSDYEGDPRRRPLTYDEVQALFDAADGHVEQVGARRGKGGLAGDAGCGRVEDDVCVRITAPRSLGARSCGSAA
jgi:hypothetical protein